MSSVQSNVNHPEMDVLLKVDDRKIWPDILFREKKLIVEFNGDYWHCNPQKYAADFFHKNKQKTAQEIWEEDAKRQQVLEKNGYKV
ncbi:MAG: hypothetical protein AAB649_02490, partial [Patescibacteria group bacterium]